MECGRYTYGTENITIKVWEEDHTTLRIGSFCSIADNITVFLGGDHQYKWVTTFPFSKIFTQQFPYPRQLVNTTKGDVIIGNDVWLGSGCTIMSGVKIGDGSVIGANSTVTRDVEPYSMVAGSPAKLIRKRFDEDTIKSLLEIQWWNLPEAHINALLPFLLSENTQGLITAAKKLKHC